MTDDSKIKMKVTSAENNELEITREDLLEAAGILKAAETEPIKVDQQAEDEKAAADFMSGQ